MGDSRATAMQLDVMRVRGTLARRSGSAWIAALVGGAVVLSVAVGLTDGRSVAATSPQHVAIVASGDLQGRPWRVVVGSQGRHRKGVCLQTLTKSGEVLACAAPAKSRGIVTVESDGRAAHGRSKITVMAAALDQAVGTLRLVREGGSVMNLHPRPIGARRADSHIKNFDYLAKAVPGSICAERLETIGAGGKVLWEVPKSELERMGLLCERVPGVGLVPNR
jgi:hypothetical protein